MIDFPSPILSVSPEVVRDLDGEDALYGLWTVFTKCKESLKDGRRLENISWRLWYREMSLANSHDHCSSGSMSPSLSDAGCPSPMTPVSESDIQSDFFASSDSSRDSLLPIADVPSRHSWHGGGVPPPTSNLRRLSTASMPARPGARSQHSQCVGSIIVDILPAKVIVPAPATPRKSPGPSSRRVSGSGSNPSTAKPSPAQNLTALVHAGVPKIAVQSTPLAHPRPTLALPSVQLPSTPPTLAAPRVVVVNPTPHPTPPATPHPSQSTNTASLPHATSPSRSPARLTPSEPLTPAASPSPRSKPSGSVSNQGMPAPPHPEASDAPATRAGGDETLKPSDRRFFLQSSESPDRESPERPSPELQDKPSDAPEPSPSSTTSSQLKSDDVAPTAPRRPVGKPTARRGKDLSRFTATRSNSRVQMHRQTSQRKGTEPKKTTFNIGSVSSNGTRADGHGKQLQKTPAQSNQAVPKPRPPSSSRPTAGPAAAGGPAAAVAGTTAGPAAPATRKGLVMSTSSEYTTDSDEDSEWASEDNNSNDDAKEKERQQRESKLREAAEEAQRQRDMFAKVPKRSYSNLNRTRSGLLSQLLNPDPAIFPPSHPYRQSFSTQDMTQLGRQAGKHGRLPPPNYPTSRSSAAMPLAAQMTPLAAQITPMHAQAPSTNGAAAATGYRPKGRPQGQELEETDTEEDAPDNGLQLSTSLAHQKLAELAGPSRRRASAHTAVTASVAPPPRRPAADRRHHNHHPLPSVTSAPIALAHPYNLPAPAAPMTPRTTRRQMLATELSESLRRNLLWERQVSKVNMLGGARRGSSGVLGQRLQPLTAANPQDAARDKAQEEREERKRAAMARNRSWADDYHYAGW